MLEFAAPAAPAAASGDLSRPLTLPPSPPPIMLLHRAAGIEVGGGGAGVGGGGGVLAGMDLLVEWQECGSGSGSGLRGAHHLRAIAEPDGVFDSAGGGAVKKGKKAAAAAASHAAAAAKAAGLFDVRWTLEGPSVATLPAVGEEKVRPRK